MPGFDKEPTPERPTSVDPVWRLASLMPRRFRALVIFAAFTGRRCGELLILTPEWCTLVRKLLSCRTAKGCGQAEVSAGFCTVAPPSVLVAVLCEHLAEISPSDPEGLIFIGPKGAASRRNNFHRSARWPERVAEEGLPAAAVVNTTACATSAGR